MAKQRRVTKPLKRTASAAPAVESEAGEGKPRRKKHHIQPRVLEILRKADGQPVTLKEITTALDCPNSSVQHAVLKLRETVPQIEVVTKGQVWKWDAQAGDQDRSYAVDEDIPTQPPVPAQRPAPAVETKVLIQAAGERYLQVGTDRDGKTIVRKDGGDLTLYVLIPL